MLSSTMQTCVVCTNSFSLNPKRLGFPNIATVQDRNTEPKVGRLASLPKPQKKVKLLS